MQDQEITYDYEEEWYPEEPGQIRYAFCDNYEIHEPHTYCALNGWTLECSGFDDEDYEAMVKEQNAPPCEHGLSASLCAGPGHYPMD